MRSSILLGLVLFVALAQTLSAGPVQVVEASGLIQVLRSGARAFQTCRSGETVAVGDRIRTGNNAVASLLYADGTRLRLKGNTLLQLMPSGYRLRYGRTWVRVAKQGRTFRTLTPNAVVSVRGTIYSVSAHRRAQTLGQDIGSAVSSRQFLNALPRAHVAGGSLLLAMLSRAGTASEVKVYRGSVAVEALTRSTEERNEYILERGHSLAVVGTTVGTHRLLDVEDYKEWGIDFRRRLMSTSPANVGQSFGAGTVPDAANATGDDIELLERKQR